MVVEPKVAKWLVVVGQRDDPQLIRPAPIAGLGAGTGSRVRLCQQSSHKRIFYPDEARSEEKSK